MQIDLVRGRDAMLLAECDEDAQKALEVVERFYLRWGMVPNPKKCEVIVWAPGGTTQTPPKLKLIGRELSVKSEIVYLGMHMTKRPTWESTSSAGRRQPESGRGRCATWRGRKAEHRSKWRRS